MGATKGVSSNQSNDLLVVESHAVEDVTDVRLLLGGVGKTSVRGASSNVLVLAARSPRDGRATKLLDGAGTSQGPQVGVGDPGELGLDGLQEVSGVLETSVGAVVGLGGKSHGGTVASTSASLLVVGTACVPCQTDKNLSNNKCQLPMYSMAQGHQMVGVTYGSIAAIVIVGLVGETVSNGIVHLLVVLLGGDKVLGADGGITTLQVEVGANTTSGGNTSPQEAVRGLGLTSLRGIAAARGSTEALRGEGKASTASSRSEGRGSGGRAKEGPGSRSSSGCHCERM